MKTYTINSNREKLPNVRLYTEFILESNFVIFSKEKNGKKIQFESFSSNK